MAADTAGGGLNQMEDHYKTFIVGSRISRGRRPHPDVRTTVDGEGFRRDRWCWPQLRADPHTLVGH